MNDAATTRGGDGPDETSVAGGQVLVRRDGGVLRLTLNRPETLNAVNTDMFRAMETALVTAEEDPSVRVVTLEAAGRGFCSGADILSGGDEPPATDTLDAASALITAIRRFPRPVVAITRGPVAGIGVSLALSADLVVAADDAYFLLAFAKIGLMPDGGATALVAASIGRARAMRMALLGERIPAPQALEWGLVSHVSPAADHADEAEALVQALAQGPSESYRRTKIAVNDATLGELDNAFRRERAGQVELFGTADFGEGVRAFAERRPADFQGR